jgi:hypothetical protein
MHNADERWIQWWCAPWQWAHADWKAAFAAQCGLELADCDDVLRSHHNVFLQHVGIQPSQPPEPIAPLMQWLDLSAVQQRQALALVGRICQGRTVDDDGAAHEAWCRAVAKALRPGTWLSHDRHDPQRLLAAWVGEDCWSRLRLSWSPDQASRDIQATRNIIDVPANKLQTLWQSVLWRVSTP